MMFAVHPCWYEDGIELGRDKTHENLWRFDFWFGENAYQAQLFIEATDDDPPVYGDRCRLFIERDNRIPREEGGDGERWDYACAAWDVPKDEALSLLALGDDRLVGALYDRFNVVAGMPNDTRSIRAWARFHPGEIEKVEAYWKKKGVVCA